MGEKFRKQQEGSSTWCISKMDGKTKKGKRTSTKEGKA